MGELAGLWNNPIGWLWIAIMFLIFMMADKRSE